MASVFKPVGFKKYVIMYTDENGERRKKTASTTSADQSVWHMNSKKRARVRDGLLSPSELNVVRRQKQALDEHLDKYHQFLLDADKTAKFADLARRRLRKLFG